VEVVSITAPSQTSALAGARVEELLVEVGDETEAGQVVAILDTNRIRAAAVAEAKAKVEVARRNSPRWTPGPKPEEVRAQEAAIRRSEADLAAPEKTLNEQVRLVLEKAHLR